MIMLESNKKSASRFFKVLLLLMFVSISELVYCVSDSVALINQRISQKTQSNTNLVEYGNSDSIKIMVKQNLLHTSILLFTVLIILIILLIVFLILRSIFKKRRNQRIQEIVENRTKFISKEIDKLQQQTDSLKESNFEAKTLNKELISESQQLKDINEQILEQNKKIEEQSKKIHQKNELLTQSLNYARRIQHSIFPEIADIKKVLPKTSIFFQPKEIVSGDFYWMHSFDEFIVIAEVDCTGHGVPGAFMSMIGNTLLNEIIINKKILSPQEILRKLNEELLLIFDHDDFDEEAQDEGMDLTIAVINQSTKKVEIASAMQNFFIISNNEVSVYRGDIFSIGGLISRLKKPEYTTHVFDYNEGFRIIMSSDGFVDQFGGKEKDKYGVDRFYRLISESVTLTVEEQLLKINTTFNQWKSSQEQMDDVLILAIEF